MLQLLLPMDAQSSSRRALEPAQEQEVAAVRLRRPRNETELDVLQRLRNKGARKRRERGTLLKLLVKDKLFYSRKVPVNAKLRSLRREKRGMEVQRYGTSALWTRRWRCDKITFNFYTGNYVIFMPSHLQSGLMYTLLASFVPRLLCRGGEKRV